MAKLEMITAMLIFGTLGIVVSAMELPSAVVAMFRAVIGSIFLVLFMIIKKIRPDKSAIKSNLIKLLLGGTALGFNWIFLFESYRYTGVAVGTLCYYMAPIFVIMLSPLILKEKLTSANILCSAVSVIGAVLISGVGTDSGANLRGVLYGLSAAMIYCFIVLINKKISGISSFEITFIQLLISAIVMIIYNLATQNLSELKLKTNTLALIIVIGIIHTGLAYLLYFSSIQKISAQSTAIFSYIDPITAILLSAVVLNEKMSLIQIIGTFLILGSALSNEFFNKRVKCNE
ncbi:MAG: EamA family transporter [Clostridia bacterium]|nr:EamA family transporter [Clostridia bacterium]